MEDNRIDELMDDGWRRLSTSLDAELPLKREKRSIAIWIILAVAMAGVLTINSIYNQKNPNDVGKHEGTKEKLATQNELIQDKNSIDNIAKNKISPIKTKNSDENSGANDISKANTPILHPKLIKSIASTKPNQISTIKINKSNEAQLQDNQQYVWEEQTEKVINNPVAEANKTYENASSLFPLKWKINVPIKASHPIKFSIHPIIPIPTSPNMSYYIKSSATFTGWKQPASVKIGVFAQKNINKMWFAELGANISTYSTYQNIHHNGKNYSKFLYQDFQTTVGTAGTNIYSSLFIDNISTQTIKQLDHIDESILSNSIVAIHFVTTELNMGCNLTSKLSAMINFNMGKRIGVRYENNTKTNEIFTTFNQTQASIKYLKRGDKLLRNWMFSYGAGVQLSLSGKLALRSSLLLTPDAQTITNKEINFDKSYSSSQLNAQSNNLLLSNPERGNVSIELGMIFKLR